MSKSLKMTTAGQLHDFTPVCLHSEVLAVEEELKQAKDLLSALWENRKDEHWCFEMSFTIEQATQE